LKSSNTFNQRRKGERIILSIGSQGLFTCITDPDIEGLCKRISEGGGKQRTEIWEFVPEKGYKIVFCEDPFGNIIEIFDHSY
jgi:predicted enzyme related to lactoylglutathione lyase